MLVSIVIYRCYNLKKVILKDKEGRTGVFSWCVISWFYFPWNVNLENYSSWIVIWRFCVTREELEFSNSWFYHSILRDFETQVLLMVTDVLSRVTGMRFAIWSPDVAIRDFPFFKHCFHCKNRKEYFSCLFSWIGKTKFLCPWFVILYSFCSWTVPEDRPTPPPPPPCDPRQRFDCIFKDVRANCFCASLLRRQIHMPRHATSCIERAR